MVSTPAFSREKRGRGRYGLRPAAPERVPPHSAEAEEHVLACCLLDEGQTLDRAMAGGLTADSFYLPANRVLFDSAVGLRAAKRVVSLEVVVEELKAKRLLEAVGGLTYLLQVTSKVPTTAHAGYFIEKVREKELLRDLATKLTGAVEGVYAYAGGGLDTFAPLVEAADVLESVRARGGVQLPPVLRFDEFVGEEQSALPDELVKGVLHRGAKLMIAGGSKSFKTWVLLDLALSVATGTPWWGMATMAGPVLYLNLELAQPFCEVRVRQIMAAKSIERAPGLHTWHLRGYARDFTALLPALQAKAAAAKYALIILDPIYKVLGERDENANGEVADLLNSFEALAVRTGAAIAYGHHHSKGNQSEKDARDRSSGAGAWTRDPDALIDLTPHEEEEHFVATFTLRNNPPKKPFVVEWKHPCMSVAPGLDPAALRKPGRPKSHVVDDIMGVLAPAGSMYGEWLKAAKKEGISESSFKRLLKQAQEDRRVAAAGGVYRRSAAGA